MDAPNLVGTIPDSFSRLTNLQKLYDLFFDAPSTIKHIANSQNILRIFRRLNLQGPIPESIGELSNLEDLYVPIL